jgi:hypothetical protein
MTITIVHGGQTGVDRGAHEAAIANGWRVAGYMPSDRRDELGPIPQDVARFLVPHDKASYAARTEANVASVNAALIIVHDADDPRTTPGTAKTIELADQRRLPRRIIDPATDAMQIARWIWSGLLMPRPLMLPIDGFTLDPAPARLLVAGPRESKWRGARAETGALLGRIARAIAEICGPQLDRDLPREPQ